MVRTIDIKRWDNNKLIFSYTCEYNTIANTLIEAIKQNINLTYADLSGVKLSCLNLLKIDLSFTNFSWATIEDCNLTGIDLTNANLSHISLYHVSLFDCNLSNTKLINAGLWSTDLKNINLTDANLNGVDLTTVYLKNVNFTNAKGINDQCPKEGSFIGWKKCIGDNKIPYIVKLEIPVDAKRSSSTTNRCRCSKAKVLEIQNLDGTIADIEEVYSVFYNKITYKVEEIVQSDWFDKRFWVECSNGIHFFMNRVDAVKY